MRLRIIFFIAILFGLMSVNVQAQNMESDYEVQQTFKTQYADFEQQVENVSKPDSLDKVIKAIKEFDQKYSTHQELLNKALYPDTYEKKIAKLKKSSVKAKNRAETITQQKQKLNKLENKLVTYEENLNTLDNQTDSLKKAIRESSESEKRLSGMLREYRNSLEKRDELILTFIDSMVVTYQNMNLEALQELEGYDSRSRIKSNDALELIHDISAENLQILQRNATGLQIEDYMRMAEVNHQFEQMWNKLGSKIQGVYKGDNAEMLANNISSNIDEWNNLLQTNSLDALQEYFTANNIKVGSFESSDEFYTSIDSYLDRKVKESRENRSEDNFDDLQQFKQFWNPVQLEWTDNLAYANILNKDELTNLNQKVDDWTELAQPRSNNILVYFLGGSILLAVALGVMLIREKKNKRSA